MSHSFIKIKNDYARFSQLLEKLLVGLVILSFLAGIGGAYYSEKLVDSVNTAIEAFMKVYSLIAPVAIFVILTPSLAKMLNSGHGKFGAWIIKWFAIRKVLACLWAILFMFFIAKLPFFPKNATSFLDAITQTLQSLGKMAVTSPYFFAMYAAVIVAFISLKIRWLCRILDATVSMIEEMGKLFLPIIPVFMFAIGAYVYGLPSHIAEQLGSDGASVTSLQTLHFVGGFSLNPNTALGMILVYLTGAFLTAIACFIWHFVLILMAKSYEPRFTIRSYFRDYWIKVYPLLWATSSEALATPLNLYLVKRYTPWISDSIRRFVIGMGSYMNINGTIINVFILGVIVLNMLGYPISIVELLLIIPVVFLISYGVPGIPGELILFAGPMATILNLPETIVPTFLAMYIGLQIGLPDSFRTGNNSTDNQVAATIINAIYNKKFATPEKTEQSVGKELELLPENT